MFDKIFIIMNGNQKTDVGKERDNNDIRFLLVIAIIFTVFFHSEIFSDILHRSFSPKKRNCQNEEYLVLQSDTDGTLTLVAYNAPLKQPRAVLPNHTPFYFLPVPINFGDKELIMSVPGIGSVLADRIIAYRQNRGDIWFPESLLHIRGIGAKKLERFKKEFSFETRDDGRKEDY